MQEKEIVRNRIHRDFLIRLCEGEFPLGSAIPSLPELCTQYHVGKNTMIKVIQMLKEDGFVETTSGKAGQVLFDCNKLTEYMVDLPGFICDKDILFDYYHAIRALFPSICTYASMSCGEKELVKVKELIDNVRHAGTKDYIRLSIQFFRAILATMENQLLKKTVEITLQETMIPGVLLCGHKEVFKDLLLQVADQVELFYIVLKQKNFGQLKQCWEQLLTLYQKVLETALALDIYPNAPISHDSHIFQNINDEKCFILAFTLRDRIIHGTYGEGELLPSISQAKEFFQVSPFTIRKAYQILGEMGLTQTVNGHGTIVMLYGKQTHSKFLEKAALDREKSYLEAVEFLEITYGEIIQVAKQISFSELRYAIGCSWNSQYQYSTHILLYYLFLGTASPAILSMYQVISNYLYWGYYLKDILATDELRQKNHIKCIEAITTLEKRDLETADKKLQELLKMLHPIAE